MAEGGNSFPPISTSTSKKHTLTVSDSDSAETPKKQRYSTLQEVLIAGDSDGDITPNMNLDVEPSDEVQVVDHFRGFPSESTFGNDLCAIIIGNDAKTTLLKSIKNAITIQEKALNTQQVEQFVSCQREQETNTVSERELQDTRLQDVRLVDEDLVKTFQEEYAQFKRSLNISLVKFEVDELRQKTETQSEYEKFTKLRKDLTWLYKNGQHLVEQIRIHNNTGHFKMITCDTNFLPLGLSKLFRHELQLKIEHTVNEQNIVLLHTLIKQQLEKQREVTDQMKELPEFVIAKAYRTVTLSHKDLSDGAMRYREQFKRKEDRDYKEVRFVTESRQEPQRERYRKERRDRDTERYKTNQRSYDSERQRTSRRYHYKDRDSDYERAQYHTPRQSYSSDSDDDRTGYQHRTRRTYYKDKPPYDMRVQDKQREPYGKYRRHTDDNYRVERAPIEEFRDPESSTPYQTKHHRYSDLDPITSEDEPNQRQRPRQQQIYRRTRYDRSSKYDHLN